MQWSQQLVADIDGLARTVVEDFIRVYSGTESYSQADMKFYGLLPLLS